MLDTVTWLMLVSVVVAVVVFKVFKLTSKTVIIVVVALIIGAALNQYLGLNVQIDSAVVADISAQSSEYKETVDAAFTVSQKIMSVVKLIVEWFTSVFER